MGLFTSIKMKYFMTIIEEGSVAKACEKLHLTRTPVSKVIADIESSINMQLFTRNSTGLQPNSHGIKLYEELLPIYHQLIDVERSYINNKHREIVKILIDDSVAPLVSSFVANYLSFNSHSVDIKYKDIFSDETYDFSLGRYDLILTARRFPEAYPISDSTTFSISATIPERLDRDVLKSGPVNLYCIGATGQAIYNDEHFNWLSQENCIESAETDVSNMLLKMSQGQGIAIMPEAMAKVYYIPRAEVVRLNNGSLPIYHYSSLKSNRIRELSNTINSLTETNS